MGRARRLEHAAARREPPEGALRVGPGRVAHPDREPRGEHPERVPLPAVQDAAPRGYAVDDGPLDELRADARGADVGAAGALDQARRRDDLLTQLLSSEATKREERKSV